MELENYLEDHVPAETAPHQQLPFVVGNKLTNLAHVDAPTLARIKTAKTGAEPGLERIEPRGMEDLVLAKVDSSIREQYAAFNAAIERGDLLPTDSTSGKSADDYYRRLIKEPSIQQLHGLITRNNAAALVDESQQVTNKLLKSDPEVTSDITTRPFLFDHIPAYLGRAIELLGDHHFMYRQLKAKQCYFIAKTYRPDNYPTLSADSLYKMSFKQLETGLDYDSLATYIYVELGYSKWVKYEKDGSDLTYIQQALERSPNWAYAHYLAGLCYLLRLDHIHSEMHFQRAIDLDSTFLPSFYGLRHVYANTGQVEKEQYYRNKFIRKAQDMMNAQPDKVLVRWLIILGGELRDAGRLKEAVVPLLKAEKLTKGKDWSVYNALSQVYVKSLQFDSALIVQNKLIELNPLNPLGHIGLGYIYDVFLNQPEQAAQAFKNALALDSNNVNSNLWYARLLNTKMGRKEESVLYYKKVIQLAPTSQIQVSVNEIKMVLANLYLEMDKREDADTLFKEVINALPNPPDPLELNLVWKAFLGLGQWERVENDIRQALENDPDNNMLYYQGACLYSLAKREDKALELLELALEKGFKGYEWLQKNSDPDLDNIRDYPGFKALLKKYFPEQVKD